MLNKIIFCIFWIITLPLTIIYSIGIIIIDLIDITGEIFTENVDKVIDWWKEKLNI
jgi:hypothetical protein